jgi:phytoene/squalene synthetase
MADPDRIREAYRHCEALVRTYDKDRYLAALFAPAERRPYLFCLYAFDFEIARVKAAVREPMAGMIRLQWWTEAIGGLRAEEAAASPVMIALQEVAQRSGVSLKPLLAAIEARQGELHGAEPAAANAAIMVMAAHFLGAGEDNIAAAADSGARALACAPTDPDQARDAYRAFRSQISGLPDQAQPAFLSVALVPLLLKSPDAPQWRKQVALLRTAWFGFPRI